MAVLITGGARSGKSAFAERYARSIRKEGIYVATGQAFDDEMADRIRQHRLDREKQAGITWTTVEEPFKLAEWLQTYTDNGHSNGSLQSEPHHSRPNAISGNLRSPVILVDCLTLWLTNHLLREEEDPSVQLSVEIDKLIAAISAFPLPLLLVTNEVGDGIVPSYPLGRRFRDEAGRLNQRAAAVSERVFLVTSGIPVDLRSIAFRFEEDI
ncbi:bifunctional adenosylcobinamide kinase/adenosylcobinamide-phosphate guanylyltransferase [Paenibacillus sp. PAMC21692]|uniref:bifunctional adenosylcobinamide kinase/adenosylcobinamide-phosphate guanylyltransferase n=1 Tax=Paenibacillus sp. PAMC21692 TaxID=2762320 RepID=UPI00164DD058|nr:bifunctional adenosylcobinamide kinase/adenosylcobinamide-phosphate guanylyltransferase [Paenibacillus sp. PAMC21692]QNK54930.1 bifunctional adenosylcobinamide kinase/adenosylcobinamide-phosphate guanylyltransferase [Paenibacillus sp. PAMC21692]